MDQEVILGKKRVEESGTFPDTGRVGREVGEIIQSDITGVEHTKLHEPRPTWVICGSLYWINIRLSSLIVLYRKLKFGVETLETGGLCGCIYARLAFLGAERPLDFGSS
jgi:hypothetical protein